MVERCISSSLTPREMKKEKFLLQRHKKKLHSQYTFNMSIYQRPNDRRFQLSYREEEVPEYQGYETYVRKRMGIGTRSRSYKTAMKYLYKALKANDVELLV